MDLALEDLERLVREGRFHSAEKEANELLAVLDGTDHKSLAHAHFWLAKAHMGAGAVFPARHAFDVAHVYAERCADWTLIGRIRMDDGENSRRLGDAISAIDSFELFLRDLHRYPSLKRFKAAAYHNLGLAHRQRREFEKAITFYDQAVELSLQGHDMELTVASLQNLAWVLFEHSEFAAGEHRLAQADGLITLLSPVLQRKQILARAFGALRQRKVQEAADACLDLLKHPENARTEIEVWCYWIVAECLRLTGDMAAALKVVGQAVDSATSLPLDSRILNYLNATKHAISIGNRELH